VALVMEVWPNRSRAFMAGLIGAAANVGYLLVGVIGIVLVEFLARIEEVLGMIGVSDAWTAELVANEGWRIMMILGTAPALLTFLIRLFVPESEKWQDEQRRGTTSHWETRDLLGVLVGAAGPALIIYVWSGPLADAASAGGMELAGAVAITIVGLAIALVGYTFPVQRYLSRHQAHILSSTSNLRSTSAVTSGMILRRMLLGACLSGVALIGTWGLTQWIPKWADQINTDPNVRAKEYAQIASALGAIIGTIVAALAGDWFGRRKAYCLLCILSMGSVWLLVLGAKEYGNLFLAYTFLVGACTASFYGWLPLYLPELFPTRVRATGQGFGFNFGRILAAVGVLQTAQLLNLFDDSFPAACQAMSFVYVVGALLIWIAPETRGKPLPE
jgi:MFS transporter, SHS family, sialic acid transporter